jgi:hypothetical protein
MYCFKMGSVQRNKSQKVQASLSRACAEDKAPLVDQAAKNQLLLTDSTRRVIHYDASRRLQLYFHYMINVPRL